MLVAAISTEVRLDRMRAADALDLALLDRPQQLGLQVVSQIADLVEEERPAGGQLELAELLPDRAGERALLVAEQRALDQLLGNRGEVHGDERRVGACPTPGESAARAAPCRCRSRRGSARSPTSFATFCTVLDDVARRPARADDELALVCLGHLGAQRGRRRG